MPLPTHGNIDVLVAQVYPKGMEAFRFDLTHQVKGVRFANLPSVNATFAWIRRVLDDLRRQSGWRLCFDHVAVSDWRPIDGPPTYEQWQSIVHDSIGTVNPASYDLVVILRPFRSGDLAWDELSKRDGWYVPAGFAASPPGLAVTVIGSQGLAPVYRPNWDVHLGVHEIGHLFDVEPRLGHEDHSGECVMFGISPDFCCTCRAKLGWD